MIDADEGRWVGVTDIFVCPNVLCHKLLLTASNATIEGYVEGVCEHCRERYVLNEDPNPKGYAIALRTKSRTVYRQFRDMAKEYARRRAMGED